MSHMPDFYPGGGPLYWMNDTSGQMPEAVKAFLNHGLGQATCTPAQTELVRQYCEYYINAPCWSLGEPGEQYHDTFIELRERVKTLKTAEEIAAWINESCGLGIDPL